ncbi:Variant-specific surface protein, partial [Giardia duodenalis]
VLEARECAQVPHICNNDKKPNTTGTACVACTIADCANCNEENVCEACTSNKKLSPLKDACLDSCPAGTYNDKNICKPCHTSCAECNGNANQDSCTACYPGHVLNKSDSSTTGTCIPECTGRCYAAGPLARGAAQNLTSKLAQFLAMSGGEGGSRSEYWGLFFPVFRRMM